MSFFKYALAAILLCLLLQEPVNAQSLAQELEDGFKDPPADARPHTWWHWTGGNVANEGIALDLEWMKRAGIAGFHLADVAFGSGHSIEKKIMFGTPEWLEAVKFAAMEAERLNLDMAVFSSPGWSLAGGPWVRPEQAMKKLVWSETIAIGPQPFSGQLPHPPTVNGPIRNMKRSAGVQSDPEWYAEQAVIAYPTPEAELDYQQTNPEVRINGKTVNGVALYDDDLNSALTMPVDESGKKIVIDLIYPFPLETGAITVASREGIPAGSLSFSHNQIDYYTIATLPGAQLYRAGKVSTFAFPSQKARFFRLELTGSSLSPSQVMSQSDPASLPDSMRLTELTVHSGARIHRWEDKAGYSFLFDYSSSLSPEGPETAIIDPQKIVNLTKKMDKDGRLNWEVPAGSWTILRFGYSLTGAKNRPAVPPGQGYEVDKLSREHVREYMRNYLTPIREKLDSLFGRRLTHLLLDSWEAGMQNWTDNMAQEFRQRRGYDIEPWLPALAGRVVGGAEASDRFLWDFRKTLSEMYAENFYGTITTYVNELGLKTFGEASGVSLEILEDALLCKKHVDIPMGEFWVKDLHPTAMYQVDVRGAASAAHAYGKKYVAAEAFTGGGFESPAALKKIADYWFTQGINLLVFHTSTHQPLNDKPGNAMVGTHIHRNITWAEYAAPLMEYIARSSFMLQQGQFVADIAYLLKEGAPVTMPFWGAGLSPVPPEGYDYDYVNSDILLNRMSVDAHGRITLPDGMSYGILVLPQTKTMTIKTLQKIYNLVQQGAVVMGPKPAATPGLEGYPASEDELNRLANILWGDLDGVSRTIRSVGKGKIIWGESLNKVLSDMNIEKDVIHSRKLDTKIHWIHRRRQNADIYFISNQSGGPQKLQFSFRIHGKEAERWRPDNGEVDALKSIENDRRTTIPISLETDESVFVVFRNKTDTQKRILNSLKQTATIEIEGPWDVQFAEIPGSPGILRFDSLISWTSHPDPSVQYFSGAAAYSKTIELPKRAFRNGDFNVMLLDLGKLKDVAEIFVNGHNAGVLWKEPYRLDISPYVKPGENDIRIKTINQWTNRLAGDQDLPEGERVLDHFIPRFGGKWELQESGLLGPAKVILLKYEKE